mgnify:CR=1 FL=1
MKLPKLLYAAAFFLLSACTATGPVFTEVQKNSADQAVIYIYHPKDEQYGNNEADFLFYKGQKVFRFTHGGYTNFFVEAGEHSFEIKLSTFGIASRTKGKVTVNVEEGGVYYVRYQEKLDSVEAWSTGTMVGASRITRANIHEVPPEIGSKEILSMRYIAPKLVKN